MQRHRQERDGLSKGAIVKTKECKCIKQVNDELRLSNAQVAQGLRIDFANGRASMAPPQVVLEKIDAKSRKKLPTMLCSFCPFCGSKYPE